MKKVLLLALCLLVTLPTLASAQALVASGQAFVFGIFGAPPPAQICWRECGGTVPLGDATGAIVGPNAIMCTRTDACGNFTFNLSCIKDVVRLGTNITLDATYLGGMFHVCGSSGSFDVKCGPGQNTVIAGRVRVDGF